MKTQVLHPSGEVFDKSSEYVTDEHDIIGRAAVDFYMPKLGEVQAILEVTHTEKYGVAQFVEKVVSSPHTVSVQFYLVRGKHRLHAWALRDVISQFSQSVVDLLTERRYNPEDPTSSHT